MSADAGRVKVWMKDGVVRWADSGDPTHIAYPAAQAAAMEALVRAAVARVEFEKGADGVGFTEAADRQRHKLLVQVENAAVATYLATLPVKEG